MIITLFNRQPDNTKMYTRKKPIQYFINTVVNIRVLMRFSSGKNNKDYFDGRIFVVCDVY